MQLRYKEALNRLESTSPGTKSSFFLGFLDRGSERFKAEEPAVDLRPCERCGQPTTTRFCAFCRAQAQILGNRLGAPSPEHVAAEISTEAMPAEIYSAP